MNCELQEKPSFQILAVSREFQEESAAHAIPAFWREYYAAGFANMVRGEYGICYGADGTGKIRYAIGCACKTESNADGTMRLHIAGGKDLREIPEGFVLLTVPDALWATFGCIGPLPQSIQALWGRIYTEWISKSGYDKDFSFDVEEYTNPETPGDRLKADYRSRIRIPVKRKNGGEYAGFSTPPAHIGFLARKYPELSGTFRDGALACMEAGGGGPVERHTHPHDHLFLVLDGEARIEFEQETVFVKKNGIYRVRGTRPHSVWNNGETSALVLGLTLNGAGKA